MLLLGGTTEATALAAAVGERHPASMDLTVSFAGRTSAPTAPHGTVRVGGFGGVDGLTAYLVEHGTTAVVDALHPFASTMPFNAAEACRRTGVPLLRLMRAPWRPTADDVWHRARSVAEAATVLASLAVDRALLTIGRQELDPFRTLTGTDLLVRTIEPFDLAGAWSARPLLARGPFTAEGEIGLLQRERIEAIVSKNSGGTATVAKLEAARACAIPVVMVDRPPRPEAEQTASVDDALTWLLARSRSQASG